MQKLLQNYIRKYEWFQKFPFLPNTAINIAKGKVRLGFLASPPAWAMESKPIKLEKSRAAAARKVLKLKLPSIGLI